MPENLSGKANYGSRTVGQSHSEVFQLNVKTVDHSGMIFCMSSSWVELANFKKVSLPDA
ncbi:hypothetical protein PAXRUDRAFT_22369 [Paxillus rubicundulus Ve08.2h10]|uniref:Uncharacterized protein n=1 Tax=Paxillus rubicundulus Ve08.2h10 TaxID=930991 RepID=A0A0D0BKC6_9AGAM|nr:hypothetical protein PAXRUDRAFT_22369 [Paxillus rubicundulus Ve08.2h10]